MVGSFALSMLELCLWLELGMARMDERWVGGQQVTTRAIIAADEGFDHAPNFNPEGRVA